MDVHEVHEKFKDKLVKRVAEAESCCKDAKMIEEALKIVKDPFFYVFKEEEVDGDMIDHELSWDYDNCRRLRVFYSIIRGENGSDNFRKAVVECNMDYRLFIKPYLGFFYNAILDFNFGDHKE